MHGHSSIVSGRHVLLLLFLVAGCSRTPQQGALGNEPTFDIGEVFTVGTLDGHTVFGHLHRPGEPRPAEQTRQTSQESSGPDRITDSTSVPLILAFHQGGASGEAEYAPIIPRLLDAGFAVMTIDQRRGGDRFMGWNQTADAFDQNSVSYCDAILDLEAAFEYAESLSDFSEYIAWGSSYSATLAVELGVNHPDQISRVLAFSPASGESMMGCSVLPLAFQIRQPTLFLRSESEISFGSAAADLAAFRKMGHKTYIASPGAHGSSMLVSERVEGNTEATWDAVSQFLNDR